MNEREREEEGGREGERERERERTDRESEEEQLPARFVYFKTTIGDRLGNPESSETATEIGGNTYDGGAPLGKYQIHDIECFNVCAYVPCYFDFAKDRLRQVAFSLHPQKRRHTLSLSLSLFLFFFF